ncbi:MAG: sigma-70 family RNA polymerase sigma factor [Pseudomonadota bacterium]|nr:sigma-70 family RNA polymerase sigma factor [Pseudomonadota bacterium]
MRPSCNGLVRRLRHTQDADDLAQEVFARLLRIKDAELVLDPRAYLLGIAAHVVGEFLQRRQREPVIFDSDMTDECAGQTATHACAEQLKLQNRLDLALARLPTTHKLVLLLVKRDGLSYTEAAKSSGLSVHTIEKYLVEARARLRLMLAQT